MTEVEELVTEARAVVNDYRATQQQLQIVVAAFEATRQHAQTIADQTGDTAAAAAATVEEATALTRQAQLLISRFEPALEPLAPIVERIARTVTADDAAALIKLLHATPALVEKVDSQILPVLNTLSTVAPDLKNVADTSNELSEMLGSVPGLGRVKKRVEEDQH